MWCRSLVEIPTKLRPLSAEVWSKFRPNFDTPSVEVWSKFGRSLVEVWSKFGRSLVEVWSTFGRSLVSQFGRHLVKFTLYFIDVPSKLRPNFDTGGVEIWSKFGRSLVEVWSKFGRRLVEVWCRSLVNIWSNLLCISLIYRTNFNQTSTLGVSKFGRSLVEVWSKFGRSFDTGGVEVWSKFRPNFDPPVSQFGLIDDDRNNQTVTYLLFEKYVCIK